MPAFSEPFHEIVSRLLPSPEPPVDSPPPPEGAVEQPVRASPIATAAAANAATFLVCFTVHPFVGAVQDPAGPGRLLIP